MRPGRRDRSSAAKSPSLPEPADSGAYFLRQEWRMQVEGDFHSVIQTVIGALLGVLLATAVFQLFSL